MPKRRLALFAMVGGLLANEGVAQRPVITVGGPSPDFPDLPQAVAAAAPGSVIEVRSGTYSGFATGKALRIELRGASVQAPPGAAYGILVDSMASADGFALVGVGQVTAGTLGAVRVVHCSGPVMIEGMQLLAGTFQPALDVDDAANVHLTRSILVGMPGLQANLCAMVAGECVVGGPQGAAAVLTQVLFEASRSVFVGTAGPALRMFSSQARLSSDGSSALSVLGAPPGVPVSTIEAFDSQVRWLPSRFQLAPANGAPPLAAVNSTELLDEVPLLNAGPAVLGTTASARLTMGTPTAAMIAISYLLPQPIVLGDAGLYADPTPAVLVAAGLADPAGLTFSYAVPANANLRGAVFCFQGLGFPAGAPRPSGPALWILQ